MTRFRPLMFLLVLVTTGCLHFGRIASYDEATDRGLTAVAALVDDHLREMIARAPSEENALAKQTAFYTEVDQQLRRLEFRAGALPDNARTIEALAHVRHVIFGDSTCSASSRSLRDLQCLPSNLARGPSRLALDPMHDLVMTNLRAALQLELAKKTGVAARKPTP